MGIPAIISAKERLEKFGSIDSNSISIATHFSHNGGLLHEELEDELSRYGFIVAYDGMVLNI
jgi:phosphoribosyl 1,2-cyclic phosphate phosphodiesterase